MVCILTVFILTSCTTAEITDIIHSPTDNNKTVTVQDFQAEKFKDYRKDSVIFIPHFIHTFGERGIEDNDEYTLRLITYKELNSQVEVYINKATIEDKKNSVYYEFKFKRKRIEFEKTKEGVLRGHDVISDMMTKHGMKLGNNSNYIVTVSIEISDGDKVTKEELEYIFQENTRRYLNQR